MQLNALSIEGFVDEYLIEHFEEQAPIARFHREGWDLMCCDAPRVAFAAPREHAKTTSFNHAYGLAASLFGVHPFQIKISKTYELACERVQACYNELMTNEKLRKVFRVKQFVRTRENDLIVQMATGMKWRMYAVGVGQAIRGLNWGTMRPTLIQGDDIEDDEEVLNPDRREKLMRWILNTLLPMGSKRTQFRFYGTILHVDSALQKLIDSDQWVSKVWQACDEEVTEESILWPEKFSRDRLLATKQMYVEQGNLIGFNMEYRNIALDTSSGYFREADFRPMTEEDHKKKKTYYVGGDLAYSKKQGRDWTVFSVGGIDSDGILHMEDERRGRWDGNEVIDQMYSIDEMVREKTGGEGVAEWFIESGAIKETLGSTLYLRMPREGWLNLAPDLIPTQDKAIRAVPFQARMRARGVRWDMDADWYPEHKLELLQFAQGGTRGKHDDRVDADAWLGQGLKRMVTPLTPEEEEEEEYWSYHRESPASGRSPVTGY